MVVAQEAEAVVVVEEAVEASSVVSYINLSSFNNFQYGK